MCDHHPRTFAHEPFKCRLNADVINLDCDDSNANTYGEQQLTLFNNCGIYALKGNLLMDDIQYVIIG